MNADISQLRVKIAIFKWCAEGVCDPIIGILLAGERFERFTFKVDVKPGGYANVRVAYAITAEVPIRSRYTERWLKSGKKSRECWCPLSKFRAYKL